MNSPRIIGDVPPMPIPVVQNGVTYFADIIEGQKTGWYFDQRENHALFASYCQGKTVLDTYAHSGGFGLLAAHHGAAEVTLVDRSAPALALAEKAIAHMGFSNVNIITGEAFEVLKQLHDSGKTYDCISADPPPFIKTKRDIAAGMKGYEKLASLCAPLVAAGGILMVASCSHHASESAFIAAVQHGVASTDRKAEILKITGASKDHPVHPQLPQTRYLKSVLLRIG